MSKIIDGKKIAEQKISELKKQFDSQDKQIKVLSYLVGDDPASLLYSKLKQQKASELGIDFEIRHLSKDDDISQVGREILKFGNRPQITGIMVQLPLPAEFLANKPLNKFLQLLRPKKDIDGLNPRGKYFLPAAVQAVLEILAYEKIDVKDKIIAVIGTSDLVGKPLAKKLTQMGANVKTADISTPSLKGVTQFADIVISATGVPGLITEDMVQDGVVAIDVGTTKVNGKLKGDFDFESVSKKASKITPVPGGVGPVTIAALMQNILEASK